MSYEFLTKLLVLSVILYPVMEGELIRPEFIFPAMPLIKQFIEAVILRMLMYQLMQLSEMLVVADRIQVHVFAKVHHAKMSMQCIPP